MHTSVGGKCLPLGHPPLLRILGNLEILDVDDNFQTLNKKRLHLISDGIPIGLMVLCYHQDLATFAKELNPAAQGWHHGRARRRTPRDDSYKGLMQSTTMWEKHLMFQSSTSKQKYPLQFLDSKTI